MSFLISERGFSSIGSGGGGMALRSWTELTRVVLAELADSRAGGGGRRSTANTFSEMPASASFKAALDDMGGTRGVLGGVCRMSSAEAGVI